MNQKHYKTPKEAASEIGVHEATVRRWLESGYMKGRRVGEKGWWRISVSEVARFSMLPQEKDAA